MVKEVSTGRPIIHLGIIELKVHPNKCGNTDRQTHTHTPENSYLDKKAIENHLYILNRNFMITRHLDHFCFV